MSIAALLLQLAWTFLVIGALTFGGGYAMLSLIQSEVVVHHAWLSESAFTDIVAISQMTPGPIGINSATYVGYDVLYGATGSHLAGVFGSMTATLALMLPSFVIMLLVVRFYTRFRTSRLYGGTMAWLKPAVVGLIPEVSLVRDNFPDWKSWGLLAAAFAASKWGRVNPILLILLAAVAGLILY